MHPQGDNLYGYGPTTHFLAYFRLVLGATNTPPAPRFRPVLGLAAPAAPFGSFGTFGDLGSPEPQNMHMHVLGFLAVYIPYVYLPDMMKKERGIDATKASFVISLIGVSNTLGR